MSEAEYVQIAISSSAKPSQVLRSFRDDAHHFGLFGQWLGTEAIIGSEPHHVHSGQPGTISQAGAFDLLNELPDNLGVSPTSLETTDSVPAIFGGWVGYIAYPGSVDKNSRQESRSATNQGKAAPWWFGWYDHLLSYNTATGWHFEAIRTAERAAFIDERLSEFTRRLNAADTSSRAWQLSGFQAVPTPAVHQRNVEVALGHIDAHELDHLNLTMQFQATLTGSLHDAFAAAVDTLEPPYAAFLTPSTHHNIASLSPELFLSRDGNFVSTRPIKGTRPRIGDPVADVASAEELLASTKERDENRLVVDLAIEELSTICEPGTVEVTKLYDLEPHPGVWHLVSEITGRLPEKIGNGQLLKNCFPAASITGTPKDAALELIEALEAAPRGVYTGTIGMASVRGNSDWNVAIRTFEAHEDQISLGVGGGLTAASDPAAETIECRLKAEPLIRAIGGQLATQAWPQAD